MFRSFGRLKGWAGQGGASCHSLELNGGTAAALVVVHQHRALLLHCCDAASAGGRAGRGASVRCAGAAWQRCCAGPTHAVPLGPFARLTASCRQASMRDSSDAAARTAETTGDAVLVRAGGYSDLAAAEHPALGVRHGRGNCCLGGSARALLSPFPRPPRPPRLPTHTRAPRPEASPISRTSLCAVRGQRPLGRSGGAPAAMAVPRRSPASHLVPKLNPFARRAGPQKTRAQKDSHQHRQLLHTKIAALVRVRAALSDTSTACPHVSSPRRPPGPPARQPARPRAHLFAHLPHAVRF